MDDTDRKLLGALTQDAGISYAKLGALVGLSAPATHERVKKLRAAGVIKSVEARIDAAQVGKELLAFVHVDTVGWGKSPGLMNLARFPEVEEIHSVTGDTCMVLKVRVANSQALEGLLSRIYALDEVRSTRSYVALSTYLERTAQPGISAELQESASI